MMHSLPPSSPSFLQATPSSGNSPSSGIHFFNPPLNLQPPENLQRPSNHSVIKTVALIAIGGLTWYLASPYLPSLIRRVSLVIQSINPKFISTLSNVCFCLSALSFLPPFQRHESLKNIAKSIGAEVSKLDIKNETTFVEELSKQRRRAQTLCKLFCSLIPRAPSKKALRELAIAITSEALNPIVLKTIEHYDITPDKTLFVDYDFDPSFHTRICWDGTIRLQQLKEIAQSTWGDEEYIPFLSIDMASKAIFTPIDFEAIQLYHDDDTELHLDKATKLELLLKGKATFEIPFNFSRRVSELDQPDLNALDFSEKEFAPNHSRVQRIIGIALKITSTFLSYRYLYFLRRIPLIPGLTGLLAGIYNFNLVDTRPITFASTSYLGKIKWLIANFSMAYNLEHLFGKSLRDAFEFSRNSLIAVASCTKNRIIKQYHPLALSYPPGSIKRSLLIHLALIEALVCNLLTLAALVVTFIPQVYLFSFCNLISEHLEINIPLKQLPLRYFVSESRT